MQLRLITPEGVVLETECNEVLVPASGGTLGIRSGHTELVAPLLAGELVIRLAPGNEQIYAVGSGSFEVTPKKLTVLSSSASKQ